jgi:hypothetical protein
MAHTDHDDYDITAADDKRIISTGAMLLAAALAVLVLMAIVYAPAIWGIAPWGPDVVR